MLSLWITIKIFSSRKKKESKTSITPDLFEFLSICLNFSKQGLLNSVEAIFRSLSKNTKRSPKSGRTFEMNLENTCMTRYSRITLKVLIIPSSISKLSCFPKIIRQHPLGKLEFRQIL